MNNGTVIVGFLFSFLAGLGLMWGIDHEGVQIRTEPASRSGGGAESQASTPILISAEDPSWGNADAPVTIVEFSDFECPFCSRVVPTVTRVKQEYGESKVRVVWKHNPLPMHNNARSAAEAGATVYGLGGDFWKFHDLVFANQRALTPTNFEAWALQAGVDAAEFKRALEANKYSAKVDKDMALAHQIGQDGTPAFRINGKPLSGAQPFQKFKEMIDAQLAAADALAKTGVARDKISLELTKKNFAFPPKQPRQLPSKVLTPDADAERKAKERIGSATLLEGWRAVHANDPAALAKFWGERKDKGPIVEPYPGDPRDVLVTFVLRATAPYVGLFGGTDFREKPLLRIEGSDVWYLSARMPADSRFDYAFIVADGPPSSWRPFRKGRGHDERWFEKQLDPNNPLVHFNQSRLELPAAAPQPWIAAKPEVPKGKVTELELESASMNETRRVGIYTPPAHDPKRRYPLLIAFDGEMYGLDAEVLIPLPTILDNMIAAKKIPPIIAALVASGSTRNRDLPGSVPFSAFIANELVPQLRADYRAGMTPAETIVTGSSFGGLCSAYTALHHSDVIGNVLSQSGSFQYVLGSLDEDVSPSVEGGWLIRDYAAAPRRPIRFYLDAGRFEANLLDSNRHMRDVLLAKGYPVTYAEFSGGHDYWLWRATISDGLIALLANTP
jgi:enterochelin esterase-like enzyme/protein-disulfide isomerase